MGAAASAETVTGRRGEATVDRAVGLLAGRVRCRLADAHRHLLRMAEEQNRDLAEVAAGVINLLDIPDLAEMGRTPQPNLVSFPAPPGLPRRDPWPTAAQRILDALPGASALFTPVRDAEGRLLDLVFAAVTPEAVAPDGRRGRELIGTTMSGWFPRTITSDRWNIYAEVLATGDPADVPPFPYFDSIYSVRAHRVGGGLLLTWFRHEDPGDSDRVDSTERLGNLGWGEADLVSGVVRWSDQLYRIYERDPALGPLTQPELDAMTLAEDLPLRTAAEEAFARFERVDLTLRVRVNGQVKHLRTVADAARDATGRPLRVFGIVQDITERETSAQRLAEVERQLADQRRDLAAEHALAATLQQIILPLPDGPLTLPGLKVALRYLPAGQESLVGGDWYHAAQARDGSVLLAVGDVAGHGTQAATTMAQLRHALRALAVVTTDPAVLLGHLNRLTCELERDRPELAATAVVARFDPMTRRLTWAQAGHPPPLLCRAGRTTPLARPAGCMLGVLEDAGYATATLDLATGDVLLLYTDGLVEHRRRGPDDGLRAVMTAMDDAVLTSPQRPLEQVLDRLRQANPDDDTCILAVRTVTGETRDLRHYLSLS
ncbi:SpoIIE family protein phosphatase [Actinoplanes sp. NPDC089786]|uniref:SpoIIE family protein phosphatase n=1 Tax=Actinoplanes sp. NPDC089786 TaxID=3155185 RepID=UPI0034146927